MAPAFKTALGLSVISWSLFPVYWFTVSAFRHPSEFFSPRPSLLPGPFTLEYLHGLLTMTNFPVWYLNSFVVAIGTTAVAVSAAAPMSYVLARSRLRWLFFLGRLMLIGYMMPHMLLGIPLFKIFTGLHLDDSYLCLIACHVSIALPFAVWVLWSFFKTLPVEVEEAALIDGASRVQTIFHVIMPMALPGIITASIFAFITSWTDYLFAMLMIRSDDLRTVPYGLATMIEAFEMRWGEILVGATLIAIPMVLIFSFVNRYFIRGLTAGAVKN
jgi:ABC-type glycerol-3-phosphate transport system permease component